MFLLTREHWDQIWYWPDRAGEHYLEVFQRFVERHRVGEVICGYHVPDGLMVTLGGVKTSLDPKRTMMFRIQAIDVGRGQVRVHPVAAVGPDGALVSSPTEGIAGRCVAAIGPDRGAPSRDAPLPLVPHVRRARSQLGRPVRRRFSIALN